LPLQRLRGPGAILHVISLWRGVVSGAAPGGSQALLFARDMEDYPASSGAATGFMSSFMTDRPREDASAPQHGMAHPAPLSTTASDLPDPAKDGGMAAAPAADAPPTRPEDSSAAWPPQQQQPNPTQPLNPPTRPPESRQEARIASRRPTTRRRSSRRAAPHNDSSAGSNKRHAAAGTGATFPAGAGHSQEHNTGGHAFDTLDGSSLFRGPMDSRIAKMLEASKARMLLATEIRALLLVEGVMPERPSTNTPDWAIYRECPKQRRRARNSDRWANSGGMKGSRDLPYNSTSPYVRRRYGSVFAHKEPGNKGKRSASLCC
jgi:hypothetical protein